MKESKLIEMQNKITSLTNVVQQLINENTQLRNLAVGTLETIKHMPDYNEAIESLKQSINKNKEEKDGVIKQDTK